MMLASYALGCCLTQQTDDEATSGDCYAEQLLLLA